MEADAVKMAHLAERYFPILPDVTEIKFEHSVSHKCHVIKRRQVPIEPVTFRSDRIWTYREGDKRVSPTDSY